MKVPLDLWPWLTFRGRPNCKTTNVKIAYSFLTERDKYVVTMKHYWEVDIGLSESLNDLEEVIPMLTREQRGGCKFAPPPMFFSNIFATRANFKMRSKPIPRGSNSGCFDVSPVNIALSSTWSELENQGHPPWKNRRFSAGRCNLSLQQHRDIIPTATPTFTFRPRPTWIWQWLLGLLKLRNLLLSVSLRIKPLINTTKL